MYVCMILDPNVCMYDAYSLDPDTRDYDAHMYDAFIQSMMHVSMILDHDT